MTTIELAEKGILPDSLIRFGIRQLLRKRLHEESAEANPRLRQQKFDQLIDSLRDSPVAIDTRTANEQHYEVPTSFFSHVLGARLKYSSCYWPEGVADLNAAENAMLALSCERAELADGQAILELGCGWGSLSLWMAEQYPNSKIVAVSNSKTQREFIVAQAQQRGLSNIEVITCDMNDFEIDCQFDRVVSVEMFEHIRNYAVLMQRVARWLKKDGKLFVHIFCHRSVMYPFETEGESNWMGRYFFTGGLMPSADTLLYFQDDLHLENRWLVEGSHYQRTLEAWLTRTDLHSEEILEIFVNTYGEQDAAIWFRRWRMFFMACAELFGFRNGSEWLVAHYLFNKPSAH